MLGCQFMVRVISLSHGFIIDTMLIIRQSQLDTLVGCKSECVPRLVDVEYFLLFYLFIFYISKSLTFNVINFFYNLSNKICL